MALDKNLVRGTSKVQIWLDRRFGLSGRRTTLGTEFRAGVATFVVMAYIILVNPSILSSVTDSAGGRLEFSSVLTLPCLTSAALCILMGLVANVPLAMAPGMGLNAVVAYQLVGQMKLTWPQAMTVIFLEGVVILVLVLTRFREAVLHSIHCHKSALSQQGSECSSPSLASSTAAWSSEARERCSL